MTVTVGKKTIFDVILLEDMNSVNKSTFVESFLKKIFAIDLSCYHLQLRAKQTTLLVNKHYQNEVTLTGQSPPLKCCQPLKILTHFITGLDLSMIEIWGL